MFADYPPVTMYNVRVNNGPVMPSTDTMLTIPGSTFSAAGSYSFSVTALNILGEGTAVMADMTGM